MKLPENERPRDCARCGKRFKPSVRGPNIEQPYCDDCMVLNGKEFEKVFG